jgi:flagellar hook-associated protein 2
MAGISGIGSGIDINSIVGALVNAEKAPKEAQLARLEKASTTKFSGLGQLKGALSDFQSAMKGLNSLTLFEKRTASSSNTAALTASATKTALPGSYSLTVERLASSSKVTTAAMDSSFAATADGTLSVKLGASGAAVAVDVAIGDSLAQIRDKLNAALKDQGISANVISNPADGQSRLVLSAKATGSGQDVFIETADAGLADFSIDGSTQSVGTAAGYLQQAADAQFSIDGLSLNSAGNSVDGVIPDVTLNLVSTTEAGKPLTLTVGRDTSGVTANIKKFVEAYNKLIATTSQLTSVVQVGEGKAPVAAPLVGDATVRTLLSGVRNELVNPAEQGGVKVLADLGITTQKDGTLKIDDAKLSKALSENFDAVGSFLAGSNGLMNRVDKRIEGFIQAGGVLEQRMNGLRSTLTGIDKQRENLTRRVEQMQTRLFAQFNAMDSLVGRLNDTSARLTQALGSLPGVVRKDS